MRLRWILGSFVLVAGAAVVSTAGLAVLAIHSPDVFSGMLGFLILPLSIWSSGAFVGGMVAARVSRGRTVAEPAVGALLFGVGSGAAILATKFGDALLRTLPTALAQELLPLAWKLGGAFVLGGLLGAWVGEQIQKRLGSAGQAFMAFLTFFAVWGGVLIAFFSFSLVEIESLPRALHLVAILGGGALLGGLTSGLAGAKLGSAAVGALLVGALPMAFAIAERPNDVGVVQALAFLVSAPAGGAMVGAAIGAVLRPRARPGEN